jgi:hypothetical protein
MTIKEILDAVSTLGALGFTIIAVWAFATGRIVPASLLEYERKQKDEAVGLTKGALQSHDRIADAVEERNRLDRERLEQARLDATAHARRREDG